MGADEEAMADLLGLSIVAPESESKSTQSKQTLLVIDREGQIKVSPSNSYVDNQKAVYDGKCTIPDGYSTIQKKDLISRFTLTSCANGFALIASISHVADGYTYYKIMGMLSENGKIESLEVNRKHEFSSQDATLVGEKQKDFLFGMNMYNMGFMYQMLASVCCCSKPTHVSYFVDPDKVKELKDTVQREGEVQYCSTADIIASHFCNVTKPRLLQYAVNLRPRMTSILSERHA